MEAKIKNGLHGGRILKKRLIAQKRRASGDKAGCSFVYVVVKTPCTGTVCMIRLKQRGKNATPIYDSP